MNDPSSIRTFAAVNLAPDLRDRIFGTQEELKKADAHVTWVPAQNLHISLAFIGDIFSSRTKDISIALDEAAAGTSRFEVDIQGLGAFGKKDSPRVVWVGVINAEPLTEFYTKIKNLFAAIDIRLEDRPYRPHITLGRVKSGRNRHELLDAMKQYEQVVFGRITVSSIDLMKSTLHPSGASYGMLHSAALQ